MPAKAGLEEPAKVGKLLNDRYFNPKLAWYVDLVPTGKDGLEADRHRDPGAGLLADRRIGGKP